MLFRNRKETGGYHALPRIDGGAASDGSPKGKGSGPQLCGVSPPAAGADAGSRRYGTGAAAAGGGAGADGGAGAAPIRGRHAGSAAAPGTDGGSKGAPAGRCPGSKAVQEPGDSAEASGACHSPAGKLRGRGAAPGQRRQPGYTVYTHRGLFAMGAADAAQGKKGGGHIETVGAVQRRSGGEGRKYGSRDRSREGDRYGGGHPVLEVQEQSGAGGRAGCWQNCHCRGTGPADGHGQRAAPAERKKAREPEYGVPGGRHQVPGGI